MRIIEYLHRIDFVYGGPQVAVVDLCRVLHRRGHDVTLATTVTRDVPPAWLAAVLLRVLYRETGEPATR